MGFFNKLFKGTHEGLIEAYLETYRNLKDTIQVQMAAQQFEKENKLPKELHFANTAIGERRYDDQRLEDVMSKFMQFVMADIEEKDSLTEKQMIMAMLRAAHLIETYRNPHPDFIEIADDYISKYFYDDELNNEMTLLNIKAVFADIAIDLDMGGLKV